MFKRFSIILLFLLSGALALIAPSWVFFRLSVLIIIATIIVFMFFSDAKK